MDPTPTTQLRESPLDNTSLIDKLTKAGIKVRDFALEEPHRSHQRKKLLFVQLLDEVQTTPGFVMYERKITEGEEMRPLTEVGVRRHKQPTQEGWDTAPNILRGYDDAQSDEVAACTS